MRSTRYTILFFMFAFLLLNSAFAAQSGSKKTEAGGEKATKSSSSKPATAKPASADEGFSFENIQKTATTYAHKAFDQAEKLLSESRHRFAKYSRTAQENADKLVDKYFAVENAKLIKANLFNVYGVLAGSLALVTLAFTASKINWLFSLNPLRAFFSAFGLGVFSTLYALTYLVKDPATLVAKNAPEALESFETLTFVWFSLLVALNGASITKGGLRNILQFLISALLFVDHFGARGHIEAQTGTLPPHSLNLLVFFVLTLLSFAELDAYVTPSVVYPLDFKIKTPVLPPSSSASATATTPTKDNKKVKVGKKN